MTYTAPRTWTDGEVPTETEFNTDLRDNLAHQRAWGGRIAYIERGFDSDTIGTTERKIMSVPFTAPTGGRDVYITANVYVWGTIGGDVAHVHLYLDGSEVGQAKKVVGTGISPPKGMALITHLAEAISAGTHTAEVKVNRAGGGGSLIVSSQTQWPTYLLVEGR